MSDNVSPVRWAIAGLKRGGRNRHRLSSATEMSYWLDSDISPETIQIVRTLIQKENPIDAIEAVRRLDGLSDDELSDALSIADTRAKIVTGSGDSVSGHTYRYISDIIIDADDNDGSVYMAKSVNYTKARIVWDLDDANTIINVNEYERYEPFGWKKLKEIPHGKHQIDTQYGDELSDSLYDELCGDIDTANSNSNTHSAEELTVSCGRSTHQRENINSDELKDTLEAGDDVISFMNIDTLICFPPNADDNLSNYWDIAGESGDDMTALANCNKSTYEYLEDCDAIVHINDYRERASSKTLYTTDGKMDATDVAEDDNILICLCSQKLLEAVKENCCRSAVKEALADAVNTTNGISVDGLSVDRETITFALIDENSWYESYPVIRHIDDSRFIYTENNFSGRAGMRSIWDDILLYMSARLSAWDTSMAEMQALRDYYSGLDLSNGGFDLIETLALLHDSGKLPYSEVDNDAR